MTDTLTIAFHTHRCHKCGAMWAMEGFYESPSLACPRCFSETRNSQWDRINKLEKQVASLRGVITRMKGRK